MAARHTWILHGAVRDREESSRHADGTDWSSRDATPSSPSAVWLWVTLIPHRLHVSLDPDPTPVPSGAPCRQTELETSQMQTQIGPLIANQPSESSVS